MNALQLFARRPPRKMTIGPVKSKCLGGIVALAMLAGFSAGPAAAAPAHLTLYGAQHAQMLDILVKGFKAETGIDIDVRSGSAPQLANQLAEEGSSTPADVFITENSPELVLLGNKGLFAPVDATTLAKVPAKYSSPKGLWLGILARENVLVYNTGKIKPAALPASLLDLAKPAWKGKLAIAPTDADFLPLVDAVAALKGKAVALDWLKGLKANSQIYDDDEGVAAAVDRGSVAVGIINNYYYYRYRVETGAANMHSAIHHFTGGDVGALVNISGAAVLKASKHQAEAQKFLAYIVSKPTQSALAQSDVDFEYPLAPGVAANPVLKPFDQLQPPAISIPQLGDDSVAGQLLREAGLL